MWGKYSLEDKQKPADRKRFKEKLADYLRLAEEKHDSIQIWFWDECGFSLRVIRRKNWTNKGKRRKIKDQRRNGRVNIMGGLRYSDKKRVCFVIDKGDSNTFFEQLKNLTQEIKKEWVEQGNNPEDFEKLGPQIIIILDNASFHKKLVPA